MRNRKIQTVCILFFFLMALNISAQIPTRRAVITKESSQKVVNPNIKDLEKAQANLKNIKKEYFKTTKVGNVTQKEGERTLKVVDDNFLETSETKVTTLKDTKTPKRFCATQKIDVNVKSRNFKQFPSDGAPDWLKPGIVMKAQDFIIGNGKMEERYDRSPIVLQTDLQGVGRTFVEVANPKMRHLINDALNTLISQNARPVNANMYFKFYEVNSLEEFGLKLNGKFSAALGTTTGSMGLNYGTKKSSYYYVIEFNQHMFSVSLNSIDANNLFKDPSIPTDDYIYLSRVNYGRRGLILIKSTKSLEDYKIEASVSTKAIILDASLNTAINKLQEDSEVKMELFFYGGTPASAIKSIEQNLKERKPDILDFIKGSPADHKTALPIGYDIKNLDNQIVGLENHLLQPSYETCIDYPIDAPKKELKLKVTLIDLQCIGGRDGGGSDPDDYAIQQYIVYKAKGKEKTYTSRSINVFSHRENGPVQAPNQKNILISGDAKNQLHVKQNRNRAGRGNVINNSLVFTISHEEFMDPTADFKIYTWLKEYSSTDKVLANNIFTSVKIKDVIELLLKVRNLNENTNFPDGQIGQSGDRSAKFHSFGVGYLMLAHIQELQDRYILEGPIKLGDGSEKAAAWIGFELE